MRTLSLTFLDPSLEFQYQKQNELNRYKLFSTFLIFQIIFLIFMLIFIIIQNHRNYDHIIIFSASLLFFSLIRFFKCKKAFFFKLGLNIFCLFFGILLTEFACLLRGCETSECPMNIGSIAFIIPIQSFCTLIVLTKMNWILSSFFYLVNIVYFLARMLDIDDNSQNVLIWLGFLFGISNFCYLAFIEEKNYRNMFKANYDSHQNLNLFHLLLRNIIPSSIFILNYKKKPNEIEFINRNAFKMIKKTLGIPKLGFSDANFQENDLKKGVSFSKIEEFFHKFNVMDKKFDAYEKNISQLFLDFYHSKIDVPQSPSNENSKEEIEFLTLNLIRQIAEKEKAPQKGKEILISTPLNPLETTIHQDSVFENTEKHIENPYNKIQKSEKQSEEKSASATSQCFTQEDEPKHKYYQLKIAKIHWEDSECLLVLLSDITKSKKIIELRNLDHYKNQLLASISHDLRTPLNGIIGMLNITLSQITDTKIKEFLLIGLRSASLLDFLIKDILDFSQISYKKLRLNYERFSVDEMLKEILCMMQFQARNSPIHLEYDAHMADGLKIYSDVNRIKQILINLLGNAIKFTKKGVVRLKVEEIPLQNQLKFSVEDTGIGIKKEDQGRLFQLFGKLEQTDKEINKHGIGLGLAISNNLAKLLNKSKANLGLQVESTFGKGSIFWFYVDIGTPNSKENSNEHSEIIQNSRDSEQILLEFGRNLKESAFESSKCLKESKKCRETPFSIEKTKHEFSKIKEEYITRKSPKKLFSMESESYLHEEKSPKNLKPIILIVDDDRVNLYVLEKYLEPLSVEIVKAINGVEAVKFVEKEVLEKNKKVSLILMDCNMPIMNGFEATEEILKVLEKEGRMTIPILGITANDTDGDVEKCLKAGMIRMMVKPIKKDEFLSTVKVFL